MSVKYIGRGGQGSEAEIEIELRTEFPGIGGMISTYQSIPTALRREFNRRQNAGHRGFLKHTILKKLEDHFFAKGEYGYAHITRPLGSTEEAYIYEWAFGLDGFPWYWTDAQGEIPVSLDEWARFLEAFSEAGIGLQQDCTDSDDGRISQNIVHELRGIYVLQPQLNCLWKRIDFGDRSVRIDYDQLGRFLEEKEHELRETLSYGRYELIGLALKYLIKEEGIGERALGRLEVLALDYRLSTLRHLNARGVEIGNSLGVHFRPPGA